VTGASGFGGGNCAGDPQINTGYQRDLGNRVTEASAAFGFGCSTPLSIPSQNYTYYTAGALQSYSGPDGSKTYTYDSRGLLHSISVTLPGGATESWTFTYDTDGRSLDVTYPDGHERQQLYDSEGRITSRCYAYGSQSYCYTASYDGVGNPVSTADPYGGSETYTYDSLNRLTQVTRSVGGSVEHTESYAYNLLGALHTSYDPVAGAAFTYDDQRPRLSGSGTADAAIANTLGGQPVTRNTFGQVTGLNGATLTFDAAGALSGVQQAVGSNTISETYRYDSFLRRSYRLHTETSPSTSVQELYVYDRPGTSIVGSTDPSGTARYDNDPGNIVAILNAGAQLQDAYMFASVDHPLRMAQVSYTCSKDAATACVLSNGSYPLGTFRAPGDRSETPRLRSSVSTPSPSTAPLLHRRHERLQRYGEAVVELADHVEREAAFAGQDLGRASRGPEHRKQVPSREALLLHAKLDGLDGIGLRDRPSRPLVVMDEHREKLEPRFVGRIGLGIPQTLDLCEGFLVFGIRGDELDVHDG
jgi:YD repeat-containing protein